VGIVGAATIFAIVIACLGLFALSGLSAMNRTKEIGIRKVMGASVSHLFLLLNKDTIRLALLSFLIGFAFCLVSDAPLATGFCLPHYAFLGTVCPVWRIRAAYSRAGCKLSLTQSSPGKSSAFAA
jgi:hypothetical protein